MWIISSISSRIDFQIVETDDEEIARKQRNRPQVPGTPRGNHSRKINLFTVPENNIGAPNIRNNYENIQLILIAPWKSSLLIFLLHFWYQLFASLLAILAYSYHSCLFLETIAKRFLLFSSKSKKSDNYYSCNSWQSDNYMGSNTEKKP